MQESFVVVRKIDLKSNIIYNGWGNGYVAIPPEHPLHGKSYDEIDGNIDVHGGLTYSGSGVFFGLENCYVNWWVFGFDTCHYGDNKETWPHYKVVAEAYRLKEQLDSYVVRLKKIKFEF